MFGRKINFDVFFLLSEIFKTMQFVQNIFMPKYDPTIEDVYTTVKFLEYSLFEMKKYFFFQTVEVDEKHYSLEILDTAGSVN